MLALLNRVTALIDDDAYLSDTSRLGISGGGVRVYAQYPVPKASYPCLILVCKASTRTPGDGASTASLLGWLMSTKAAAPSGQVLTQLNSIYLDHSQTPSVGIRTLLHDNALGLCDPDTGLAVWTMNEVFKADSLVYAEKSGEFSMHFQFSGLVALE